MHNHQRQRLEKNPPIEPSALAQPAVLVAQAAPETRRRLAAVLERAFPSGSIILSDRVDDSLAFLDTRLIDIAVIDPDLLDGSGLHLVQRCSRSSPLTRCVITTPCDNDACVVQALAAGALGCLLHNQPEDVLVQQLRLLAEGIPPLAPPVAGRLFDYFTSRPRPGSARIHLDTHGDPVHLSQKEEQVLALIAGGIQISQVALLIGMPTDVVCDHLKSIYLKRTLAARAENACETRYLGVA